MAIVPVPFSNSIALLNKSHIISISHLNSNNHSYSPSTSFLSLPCPKNYQNIYNRAKRSLFSVSCNPQPQEFLTIWPPEGPWISWLVGLGIAIPLLLQRLLRFTRQVDAAAETIEKVADAVENVAEQVEKVAEDVAENLPQGGKLRNIAEVVENVAENTARNAQLVEDIMDKVEAVDEKVQSFITEKSDTTPDVSSDRE